MREGCGHLSAQARTPGEFDLFTLSPHFLLSTLARDDRPSRWPARAVFAGLDRIQTHLGGKLTPFPSSSERFPSAVHRLAWGAAENSVR